MAIDKDWRRANWWDYPDDDDTPGLIQEDENVQEIMLDQGIPIGEQVQAPDDSGIMNQASGMDKDVLIRIVVEEFIKRKGRKPRSLDEIKEFYIEMQTGGQQAAGPGDDPRDEYESYRIQQIDIDPSKVLSFDEWYRMEYEGDRNIGAGGGLASILGV